MDPIWLLLLLPAAAGSGWLGADDHQLRVGFGWPPDTAAVNTATASAIIRTARLRATRAQGGATNAAAVATLPLLWDCV